MNIRKIEFGTKHRIGRGLKFVPSDLCNLFLDLRITQYFFQDETPILILLPYIVL